MPEAMQTTTLGDHKGIPVVPQRHARLKHKLTREQFEAMFSGNYGHHAYLVLTVLVPALAEVMPEWEFEGYGSEEAWRNEDYDEDQDKSPTIDQIVATFETAFKVNGAGRLGKVLGLVETARSLQNAGSDSSVTTPTAPFMPVSPPMPGESGA